MHFLQFTYITNLALKMDFYQHFWVALTDIPHAHPECDSFNSSLRQMEENTCLSFPLSSPSSQLGEDQLWLFFEVS